MGPRLAHLPRLHGVGDVRAVQEHVLEQLHMLLRVHGFVGFEVIEGLRVQLVEQPELFDHLAMLGHVGVQDGGNDAFADLLVHMPLFRREHVAVGTLHDAEEGRAVHHLQRRRVVVLHRQVLRGLNEELVVHAEVPSVMPDRGDHQRVLEVLGQEVVNVADQPHPARHGAQHVDAVGKIVVRVRHVRGLHRRDELQQAGVFNMVVHAGNHLRSNGCPDLGAPTQNVERVGVQRGLYFLGYEARRRRADLDDLAAALLSADLPLALRLREARRPSAASIAGVALHQGHSEAVVVVHGVRDLRLFVGSSQVGDRRQLRDGVLQERELALLVVGGSLHVCGRGAGARGVRVLQSINESEDLLAVAPDHHEHPLQRGQHGRADAVAHQQAEPKHRADAETDGGDARASLLHVRRREVVGSLHVAVAHLRDGGAPAGHPEPGLEGQRDGGARAREAVAFDGPVAGSVRAVVQFPVEVGEPLQLRVAPLRQGQRLGAGDRKRPLHVLGQELEPGAEGVLRLGVAEQVGEGNHHDDEQGKEGDPLGQHRVELALDDPRQLGIAAALGGVVQEGHVAQQLEYPCQAPSARTQPRGASCAEDNGVLRVAAGIDPRWLRGVLPEHVGEVEDQRQRPDDVHPEEKSEEICDIGQRQADKLQREQEEHHGQNDVQLHVGRHLQCHEDVPAEQGDEERQHADGRGHLALCYPPDGGRHARVVPPAAYVHLLHAQLDSRHHLPAPRRHGLPPSRRPAVDRAQADQRRPRPPGLRPAGAAGAGRGRRLARHAADDRSRRRLAAGGRPGLPAGLAGPPLRGAHRGAQVQVGLGEADPAAPAAVRGASWQQGHRVSRWFLWSVPTAREGRGGHQHAPSAGTNMSASLARAPLGGAAPGARAET
mmetsp:Transcript_71815/g.203730  ORF Transcript_71815/g.203730 Transcript_71815/m.203730 type:complete len:886 (+) Transcript_71815:744-3401(+)